MGRSGVTTIKGLNIAFLDGTYNAAAYTESTEPGVFGCRYYHDADVQNLKHKLQATDGDIDMLLTNEWPAGVCFGLPDASKPNPVIEGGNLEGSHVGADLALVARPRYHITAGKHLFFARPPYSNADLGAGSHVTRFIALANVGNTVKQKWLHALALTPASEMSPEALTAKPAGTVTSCPYTSHAAHSRKRAAEESEEGLGAQDWRWQQQGKKPRAPIAAPSLGRSDVQKDRSKTAFVRNVPFRASEDDIVAFFSQSGKVVDVIRKANAEGRLYFFVSAI